SYTYWALAAALPAFAFLLILTVAGHTFIVLNGIKHVSQKMKQLHRILTRALVVQALVPVVTVMMPFAVLSASNV
ncbi:hypothetical protein PENTCL1PPCAC_24745, partial [Pristionchus entomophagus]